MVSNEILKVIELNGEGLLPEPSGFESAARNGSVNAFLVHPE
jgi:hypothetical protein